MPNDSNGEGHWTSAKHIGRRIDGNRAVKSNAMQAISLQVCRKESRYRKLTVVRVDGQGEVEEKVVLRSASVQFVG